MINIQLILWIKICSQQIQKHMEAFMCWWIVNFKVKHVEEEIQIIKFACSWCLRLSVFAY